jgi:hypothetical protein
MSTEAAGWIEAGLGIGAAAAASSVVNKVVDQTIALNKSAAAINRDANFYREGAPPTMMQQTFNQTALSSTHNPDAAEVVLGKYIAGSPDSYNAVGGAKNAT